MDQTSLKTLYDNFRQTIDEMTTQVILLLYYDKLESILLSLVNLNVAQGISHSNLPESVRTQSGGGEMQVVQMEQQLYTAVSSTCSWLDGVENNVFSGSVLLAENVETQLQKQEVMRTVCEDCASTPPVI